MFRTGDERKRREKSVGIGKSSQAVGNMHLRLHHTISFKFQNLVWATELWHVLKDTYGQPGVAGVYMEFKAALETTIPNNADPSLAIDKILAHFGRMEEGKASVPSYVQAMILLAKIPPAMESLTQLFCQGRRIQDRHPKDKKSNPTCLGAEGLLKELWRRSSTKDHGSQKRTTRA